MPSALIPRAVAEQAPHGNAFAGAVNQLLAMRSLHERVVSIADSLLGARPRNEASGAKRDHPHGVVHALVDATDEARELRAAVDSELSRIEDAIG
jgi:hypothetical protein